MDRKLRYASLIALAIVFFICFRLSEQQVWGGVAVLTGIKAALFIGFVALAYLEVLDRRQDL